MCRNQDVAIRVDAADAAGDGSWLSANVLFGDERLISAVPGSSVIARLASATDSDTGSKPIRVSLFDARTQENVASRTIDYRVDDCFDPSGGLVVACEPGPEGETRCRAMAEGLRTELAPVVFRWDFGDGTPATETGVGYQEHRYDAGVQTGMASGYVVTVHAADAAGRELRARTSIFMANSHWALAERFGRLHLNVRSGHTRQDGGGFYADIRIHNPFEEAIDLHGVDVDDIPCRNADSPAHEEAWRPAEIAALFGGRTRLEPGEVHVVRWRPQVGDQVCDRQARVRGAGADTGRPAEGHMHMYTRDLGIHARPELAAHLKQALAILSEQRGRPVDSITPQELEQLEARGLLAPTTQESTP
jgi:hypothetical protein